MPCIPLQDDIHSRRMFEVRPDKSDNNLECLFASVGVPIRSRVTSISDEIRQTVGISMAGAIETQVLECDTQWHYPALNWIVSGLFDASYSDIEASLPFKESQDLSRRRIWRLMFKDVPVPTPTDDAVEECFGMLSDLLESEDDGMDLDDILHDIRGK